MSIFRLVRVDQESDEAEKAIGTKLKEWCHGKAGQIAGAGAGIGFDSCWATVAVEPDSGEPANDPEFAKIPNVGTFKARFGSSRLYQGLDPAVKNARPRAPFSDSRRGEHAEQTAILLSKDVAAVFPHKGHLHLYVMLKPCESCHAWLQTKAEGQWYVHYGSELNTQGKKDLASDIRNRRRDVLRGNSGH